MTMYYTRKWQRQIHENSQQGEKGQKVNFASMSLYSDLLSQIEAPPYLSELKAVFMAVVLDQR